MATKPPKTYFAQQLAGEKPLAQRTASNLCALAADICDVEPWLDLTEEQLIAVRMNPKAEPDFISVLGALGEHRAVHVYPGVAGYSWYQAVREAKDPRRLMMADCEAIQVAYPEPDEITDLDMDVINGCRFGPYDRAFQFRSVRRGYAPWYITDDEGKRLAVCLEALLALIEAPIFEAHGEEMWDDKPASLPMLTKTKGRWSIAPLSVSIARVEVPRLWLEQEEVERLKRLPKSGAVCVGDSIMPGVAGMENERPTVLNLVVALDARSGYAYPPELRTPGEPLAGAGARVLAEAIRARKAIPDRVLVMDEHYSLGLGELARALGFEIRLKSHVPVLDEFFEVMDRKMRADAASGPELVM
jgi:hypothetical protein